jgi:Tfp pilus assembly protein PilX
MMNNQKGMTLVIVLAVNFLILFLGLAAFKMTELGYLTYGSERRFQVASEASEFGLNTGVKYALDNSACPSSGNCTGTMTSAGGTANYTCFSVAAGNKCFIHATGTFRGSKVVKTVVVPYGGSTAYGAIAVRKGGVFQMGGSSSIANCYSSCPTPGISYGGSMTLQLQGGLYNTTDCPNNPKGIYGAPYAVADGNGNQAPCANARNCSFSATLLPDLTPSAFNVSSSCRAAGTCWTDLQTALVGTYGGVTVTPSTLAVTGMPARSETIPNPTCVCTNASFTMASGTNSCTGVADFSACGGSLKFSGTLTIQGIPSAVTTIVSTGNITVSGVPSGSGNFTGKNLYAISSSNITINDSDVSLGNSQLMAGGNVTLQTIGGVTGSTITSGSSGNVTLQQTGTIDTTNIIAGGGITMQSSTTGITNSKLLAEGSSGVTVQSGSGISNTVIVAAATGADITLQGGTITGSTLVTKDAIAVQQANGTITDSNLFSDSIVIQKGAGNIGGGMLYSNSSVLIQGTGGGTQQVGLTANPTLLLTGGNLTLQHTNGTTDFNGMVFTNGKIVYQATGNYGMRGQLMANSGTEGSVFQGGGNANINYDPNVLQLLATRLAGLVRSPVCGGGGNMKPYVSMTKMTVY